LISAMARYCHFSSSSFTAHPTFWCYKILSYRQCS
jgi:hypothetical protein